MPVEQRRRARCWPVALFLMLPACEDRDVQTWSPGDHDHADKAGQVGTAAPGQEEASLVAVTWRQSCATCHGMGGRGDGPTGRMMKVPDLTRPDFQRGNSDEQIAEIIRKGRNQMPSFGSLPPKVVDGLVAHVRSLARE